MSELQATEARLQVLPQDLVQQLLQTAAARRNLADAGPPEGTGGFAARLAPGEARQRVVWGTYQGDRGLLALFDGERLLGVADRTLGRIDAVQLVDLPGTSQGALVLDDHVDEMLGAYFAADRRRILVWTGKGWREAWSGDLHRQEFLHTTWRDESADPKWVRRQTKAATHYQGGELTYQVQHQVHEAPGSAQEPIPPEGRFRLVSDRQQVETFRFDPGRLRFVPNVQEGYA